MEFFTIGFGAIIGTGWFLALGNGILCPWEAIAISSLAGEFIPALKIIPLYKIMGATVYLPPLLISLVFASYVISMALIAAGIFYVICIHSFGTTTRILLAMGRKGQLPEKFKKLDPKNETPKTANILMATLTIIGPFLGKNMLLPLTNVSSLAFIFACFMVFRNKKVDVKKDIYQ